jgi:hypothetical protein
VPPIFEPEVAARAIVFAAFNCRREIWLGLPSWKAIVGTTVAPALLDRILARKGYTGQMRDEPEPPDAPANLFEPVRGSQGAHGSFDDLARSDTWTLWPTEHRNALLAGGSALLGALGLRWLRGQLRRS